MLPESEVQEIQEFANLFFYRVIDRLKQAGAPDKEYVQPKINLFRSLSKEERERFEKLYGRIGSQLFEERHQPRKPEEQETRKKELVQELLTEEERTELLELEKRDKWGKNVLGKYDHYTDNITLEESVWKDNWGTLAHELLHAVRYKILNQPEHNAGYNYVDQINITLNLLGLEFREKLYQVPATERESLEYNFIPAEVIELFGGLESMVRADLFQDCPKYAPEATNTPEIATISLAKKSYDFFSEGIRARFTEMVSNAVALHKRILGCNGDLNVENAPEGVQVQSYFSNANRDIEYLQRFCGIPLYRVKYTYEMYQILINSIMNDYDHLRRVVSMGLDLEKLTVRPLDEQKEIDEVIKNLEVEVCCEDQTSNVYWLTQVAINEFHDEFAKSWPQIFLMPGKEVEERYIAPIRKRIEELRAPL